MRVRVSCHATYVFDPPAKSLTQVLRLTPRNQESQRIIDWRIDVDVDCALRASEDAFGNITHVFYTPGPLNHLTVSVDGEVDTCDTAGVAHYATERFPPELYLRVTPLTTADDASRALAAKILNAEDNNLARLHHLMDAIGEQWERDGAAGPIETSAHAFIACARLMDIPARCVSGLYIGEDGDGELESLHAWAEAHIDGLGWVGFDPVHLICPREAHICLARGLDYLGASPVRGARSGGEEKFSVKLRSSRVKGFARY
jgi:transglutaminase-like putative cysteine protease